MPFPSLAILKSWPWPQAGNLIITRSAWSTGKAFWPLINVRFRVAKVRFRQILEYFMHCSRDRGGGGAGRAIALPLLLLGFISGLQLTWKKFPWNYWTLPYGRVGCLLVRTITTRCARKDNKMQGPNGVIWLFPCFASWRAPLLPHR